MSDLVRVLLWVFGAIGLVWIPVLLRMRSGPDRLLSLVRRSGDVVQLGPRFAHYQGGHPRYGRARTMGTLLLTDRRVLFAGPLTAPLSLPLSEVARVSDTATGPFGVRHAGGAYLVFVLKDGSEVPFMVKDPAAWIAAAERVIPSASPASG